MTSALSLLFLLCTNTVGQTGSPVALSFLSGSVGAHGSIFSLWGWQPLIDPDVPAAATQWHCFPCLFLFVFVVLLWCHNINKYHLHSVCCSSWEWGWIVKRLSSHPLVLLWISCGDSSSATIRSTLECVQYFAPISNNLQTDGHSVCISISFSI